MKSWSGPHRAVGLLTAALLATGCSVAGGGGAGESGHGLRIQPEASPSGVSPTALGSVALTPKDLAGHTVHVLAEKDQVRRGDIAVSNACRPLATALSGAVPDDASSVAVRRVADDASVTTVTLASLPGDKAVGFLTELSVAADVCADGFALTIGSRNHHVVRVERALAPPGTDQAMAFDMTVESSGVRAPAHVIVVRKGPLIGTFAASPVKAGEAATDSADVATPHAVVDAQLIKLG